MCMINIQKLIFANQGKQYYYTVLLDTNYSKKKLVCPNTAINLMNPTHHAATMAKYHVLRICVEEQAKNTIFCSAICGMSQLWTNESTGQLGLAAVAAFKAPLQTKTYYCVLYLYWTQCNVRIYLNFQLNSNKLYQGWTSGWMVRRP